MYNIDWNEGTATNAYLLLNKLITLIIPLGDSGLSARTCLSYNSPSEMSGTKNIKV